MVENGRREGAVEKSVAFPTETVGVLRFFCVRVPGLATSAGPETVQRRPEKSSFCLDMGRKVPKIVGE